MLFQLNSILHQQSLTHFRFTNTHIATICEMLNCSRPTLRNQYRSSSITATSHHALPSYQLGTTSSPILPTTLTLPSTCTNTKHHFPYNLQVNNPPISLLYRAAAILSNFCVTTIKPHRSAVGATLITINANNTHGKLRC